VTALALYALVLFIPLLFGSWRLAVAGLAAQALLVLGMMLRGEDHPGPVTAVVLVIDLGLVRGLVGPALLARALRRARADDLEVLPADLVHWVVGLGLVVLAACFAVRVSPDDGARAAHLGLAAAEVLLGFLVVVHHRTAAGQAIGVLTVEMGVVLFEAALRSHQAVGVHLGLTATFLLLLLTVAWLVADPAASTDVAPTTVVDGEVL
jgi:hydrogenase-4 membrane subunit HyfE